MKWMENSVILLIEKMPPIDGWPTQIVMLRKSRSTFAGRGGYFCVLLLSLPKEYPIPKQVKPKLTTAIKSTILIGLALLPYGFPFGYLCNQRVTVLRSTSVVAKRVPLALCNPLLED